MESDNRHNVQRAVEISELKMTQHMANRLAEQRESLLIQFKSDQQTMFDNERQHRQKNMKTKSNEKTVEALEATLDSERRLVLMKSKQHESIQQRLQKEMKKEITKAQQLQEELEAANLCMEVRRSESKKKEQAWVVEKTTLTTELNVLRKEMEEMEEEEEDESGRRTKPTHANFVRTENSSSQNTTTRLRNQMAAIQSRMEAQRAAHGREVSLLRKELALEQRRVESLAREINLLRVAKEPNKFRLKKVVENGNSTAATRAQNMVNQTMSSLVDRSR